MKKMWIIGLVVLWCCGPEQSSPANSKLPIEFQVLTHGKVIDLDQYVEREGITVFEFYADWCPPCKKLDLSLKDMKRIYGARLTVHKMDLVDWESELAHHHQIKDLPYLIVFEGKGSPFGAGPSNQIMPKLLDLLNR